MSVIERVLRGLHRVPRGFPADGHPLGLGLAAAIDAQRARGAEPLDREPLDREPHGLRLRAPTPRRRRTSPSR